LDHLEAVQSERPQMVAPCSFQAMHVIRAPAVTD
jgi:hypothetical protein